MCPANRIGAADVFLVSRHGQPSSNSEVLVHALRPRVIITNNGPRKGGQPDAMRILLSSPGLEDLWQIHFSFLGGQEYTVPGIFVANSEPGRHSGGANDSAAARSANPAGVPARWNCVLDQSVCPDGWQFYRNQ